MSNPANITVYALAPPEVTCSITSGADGMDTACVPTDGVIQLKAIPSSGVGTYLWSTTSSKILLTYATSQTVTVTARNKVSSSRGKEKVNLVFTPTGGTALPPITRNITVISVEYSASRVQNYGYDDMDNPKETHHVSVRGPGFTTVHVTVHGHGTVDDLEFLSDDLTIAEPVVPATASGDSFELTIEGKNQSKAETSIKAKCKGGPVCATIAANVYKEVVVTVTVAKLWDPTNPATKLSLSTLNLDMAAAAARINAAYKSIVASIIFNDVTPQGKEVAYDKDGSGTLTYGGGSTPEIQDIRNALQFFLLPDEHTSEAQAIIVKGFTYMFYLGKIATKGDTTLTFRGGTGEDFSNIRHGLSYTLGLPPLAEQVSFSSHVFVDLDGDGADESAEFTLSPGTHVTEFHNTSEGIVIPAEGIRIFPLVALEQGTIEETEWVLGHEIGHLPIFGFHDLDAPSNLMHHSVGFKDHKLRFKEQPRYKPPASSPKENQWEKVTRD